MAETFRTSKIENYMTTLCVRKATLKDQLMQEEFKSQRDFIRGEITAVDLIIAEIKETFNFKTPDD